MRRFFTAAALFTGLALVAVAAALAAPQKGTATDTLVFGGAADPVILDAALISDGESFRVLYQMVETLVDLAPGTTKIVPELATSWAKSPNGRTWTFNLRRNVRFHDGTPFNAQAVCANFNRWYNFRGALADPVASYYYGIVFAGFRYGTGSLARKNALYQSCRAVNQYRAAITLKKPYGPFLGAMTLTPFAIQSPAAMRQYGADKGHLTSDGGFVSDGTYGTEHPSGTGPFKFSSWKVGDRLELVRNDDYWGRKAILRRVIFRPIADNAARLQALQTGEIDGYDLVEPQDIPTIKRSSNLKVLDRPAFNVAYVGINSAVKPFDNVLVRRAVAYGLDRNAVVKSFYAGRGVVAHEFMPPSIAGYSTSVPKYNYNPERAQQLLRQAGLTLPVQVEFWYPTDVSRPYMPDPKRNFEAFAASLNKSGFRVVPKSAPWRPDYLDKTASGTAGGLHLLGWTGDYADAENFLGTFFRTPQKQWGFNDRTLFNLLEKALVTTSAAQRASIYRQANNRVMTQVYGVPYAHTKPALGFRRTVLGYVPSPTTSESFDRVRKTA